MPKPLWRCALRAVSEPDMLRGAQARKHLIFIANFTLRTLLLSSFADSQPTQLSDFLLTQHASSTHSGRSRKSGWVFWVQKTVVQRGDTSLESSASCESALDELNIVCGRVKQVKFTNTMKFTCDQSRSRLTARYRA